MIAKTKSSEIIKPFISIVIPCYNEEFSIQNVIQKIPFYEKYEIIIVDDGSTDNSVKKIQQIERPIRIISHKINKGYGASILTGIKHSRGNIIITIDSDGQHDPSEMNRVIEPILRNYADLVVGSRYLGKSTYYVPLHTRTGEYFVSLCLKLLYRQKIINNQSGFRAFNRKCLEVFNDLISTKFGFCTEVLFKAAHNGLRLMEVPITIKRREYGTSYVNIIAIMKPISLLIVLYFLKKLNIVISRFVPRKILDKIYMIIIDFIRRF